MKQYAAGQTWDIPGDPRLLKRNSGGPYRVGLFVLILLHLFSSSLRIALPPDSIIQLELEITKTHTGTSYLA